MHKMTFSVTFAAPLHIFRFEWTVSVLSLKLIIRNYTLQQNSNLTTINLGPVVTGH